jgi:hypothetical protein
VNATKPVLLGFLFLCAGNAFAQSDDKEPAAVVELGEATNWSVTDGGSSFGPTVAVEVTPIENWLELELGVTPLFTRHSTEWDTDLLLKKPWTLSKKAEFMVGKPSVPPLSRLIANGRISTLVSSDLSADISSVCPLLSM